jgi:serine/threonine protein kinase/TolB-like protein/tetratricopeptide (TPR) repeat protein
MSPGDTNQDVRERWRRIKRVAGEAVDLPGDARAAYIEEQCASDERLAADVRALVASIDQAAALYETPIRATRALIGLLDLGAAADAVIGRRIGAYRVVGEIGQGGMGAAYLAERADQAFDLRVAIKLIKRGMDTDAILARFRHERQILATLNHPHIARLLDGGTTDEGLPYFVMEYVDGLPIDAFCERHQLPLRQRLELFQSVCEAVQYAHEHRVVHRDLKPANVLVTTEGVPKLLDFGIARVLASDDGPSGPDTTVSTRAMTPEYASPEQLRGLSTTPSSDVYSLGVLLYVLLTRQLPHPIAGRMPGEIERIVCEQQPRAPSERAGTPVSWRRDLKGALDAIALTALRSEPERRYPTARALADDIGRHLAGIAILARPLSLRDRMRTGVRRTRMRVAMLSLASAIAGAMAVAAGTVALPRPSTPTAAAVESIAVLPLVNAGGDPETELVTDAMTEGLIKRLSRVRSLKVIGRDSAHRFKGRAIDPEEVARQLDVHAVLTGHVEAQGSVLNVSLDVVDARTRQRLWTGHYNRHLDALQAVQQEIAGSVVKALDPSFTGPDEATGSLGITSDPEAYLLYLKGRYVWNKRTAGNLRKSIEFFRQAIEKDPKFALAYSGVADAFGLLTEYHTEPAERTYLEAKPAATTALALDDQLAEAHTSAAYVKQFYDWDWTGAEREFRRAIELDPTYVTAHQWYAEFLGAMGRHDEALQSIKRAERLEPMSLIVNSVEVHLLYLAGRYDDAIEKGRKIVEMDPGFPEVYEYLKRAFDRKGRYADAIAARQMRRRLLGRNTDNTPALQAAAAASDPAVYWRNRLAQELEEGVDEGLQPYEMAELLAQVGEKDRALAWLEKACVEHDFMVIYMRVAPNLSPLHQEPRFRKLQAQRCSTSAPAAPATGIKPSR